MNTHRQYIDITADTPHDMGLALGRATGRALQPFLKKLPALPDRHHRYLQDCFAFTREIFPDYAAEIEAYAVGAEAPFRTFWQLLLEDDNAVISPEKCTSFVTNNGQLAGHNEDWSKTAAARLFILRRNLAGKKMFELHYAGTPGGNAAGINGSGILQMINSQNALRADMSRPRIPTNIIARFIADSTDPAAAFEKLRSIPRLGGYAHTLIRAHSTDGPHYLAEMSLQEMAVREISAFPFVHANHYILEEMLPCNARAEDTPTHSRKRYQAAKTGVMPQMTAGEAMCLLENGNGDLYNSRTIGSAVFDLRQLCAHIRLAGEQERGWIRYDPDL